MSDWQVGDLALNVGAKSCPYGVHGDKGDVPQGAIIRVVGIGVWVDGRAVLFLDHADPDAYCGGCFRKIRPDEHESCEPEFVTLLKRSKEPATASEWLLSVKDLARRLNEQSRKDPREREAGNRLPSE